MTWHEFWITTGIVGVAVFIAAALVIAVIGGDDNDI